MKFNWNFTKLVAAWVAAIFVFASCSDSEHSEVVAPTNEITQSTPEGTPPLLPVSKGQELAAAPSATASSWHNLSDYARNQRIISEAKKQLGQRGGQCKWWLQNRVVNVASGGVVYLPRNFLQNGHPYDKAMWYASPDVDMVWWGAYYSPAWFPYSLRAGQIIQMRLQNGGLHTALIESVSAYQMIWLDANWSPNNDEIVRRHNFSLADWSQKVEAWTVYQVK